jgi:hypothetical protein
MSADSAAAAQLVGGAASPPQAVLSAGDTVGAGAPAAALPQRHFYPRPTSRPLKVYAFDPSMGRRLNNFMTLQVSYEDLDPGPIGHKIAVVDFDASNGQWYEPVDLEHRHLLVRGGLEPTEADPRFHQQMVYAVASETIRRFEFALGREIRWRAKAGERRDVPFRSHLRIFPHAFQQANAFFDPKLNALLFGYFAASATDAGDSLPGQTVFTCLSHDIIAHETSHAIIHSIRQHFSETTGPDTPAFHEAFADIVALFQHFSIEDAVIETINRTGGLLYRPELDPDVPPERNSAPLLGGELAERNPLVGLAKQFGEAMGTRKALREALGTPPNSKRLGETFEPHARGAILVAAVFDAFFSIYLKRTRDLMRIARAGRAVYGSGDLHPDLAKRLAKEATRTAEHFLNICIRAIDYCPPIDLQFGEFLRAIVTADWNLVPDDPWGYRAEIIKAFRLRGIIPEDVVSYSEEALRWWGPMEMERNPQPCRGLDYDLLRETDEGSRESNAKREQRNAVILNKYAVANADDLGLVKTADGAGKVQTWTFHPIHRISPNGRLAVELVVEFLQQRKEPLFPDDPKSPSFTFRGGSTVIFDHKGQVRYVIQKRLDNATRLARQREYHLRLADGSALSPYLTTPRVEQLDFAAVHRGWY